MLNGCYPWNTNPLLLCSKLGGLAIVLVATDKEAPRQCLNFKEVTEDLWFAYFKDLRKEATENEEIRLRAMTQIVHTNQALLRRRRIRRK